MTMTLREVLVVTCVSIIRKILWQYWCMLGGGIVCIPGGLPVVD